MHTPHQHLFCECGRTFTVLCKPDGTPDPQAVIDVVRKHQWDHAENQPFTMKYEQLLDELGLDNAE